MKGIRYFTWGEWGLIGMVGGSYFLNLYLLRGQNALALGIAAKFDPDNATKFENRYLIWNAVGLLAGAFIYGYLAGKKSRADVFMLSGLCHLVVCVLTFSLVYIKADVLIYTWRCITGILLAGGFGIGITIIVEALPRPKRLWGSALITAIGMLGISLYAFIAIKKGFGLSDVLEVTTVIGTVLSLLLLALQWKYLKPLLKKEQDSITTNTDLSVKQHRRSFFYSQMQWKSLLLLGLVCLPIQFCINFLIPKLLDKSPDINWAYLSYYGAFFASVLIFAYFYDSLQRSSIIVYFGLGLQITGILFVISHLTFTPELPYVADCILLGASGGVWWIITLIAVENTGKIHRASSGIFVSNFSRIIIVLLASGTSLKLNDGTNGPLLLTLTLAGSAFIAALFLPKTFSPRLKENNDTDLMPQKVIESVRGAQKLLYEDKDTEKYLNKCAKEFKYSIFESFNALYFSFYTIVGKNKDIINITRGDSIHDEQLEDDDRKAAWNDLRDTTMLLMSHGKCLSFTNQILGSKKRTHISGILLYQAPNKFIKSLGERSLPEGYIPFDLNSIVVNDNEINKFWEIRRSNKWEEDIVACLDEMAKTAFVASNVQDLLLEFGLDDNELCNLQRALLLRKLEALKSKRGYFAYFVAPFYTEQNGIAFLITNFPARTEYLQRLTDAVAFVMSGIVELKVKDIAREEVIEQNNHNLSYLLLAINTNLESLSVVTDAEGRAYYMQEVKNLFASIDKRTRLSNILAKAQFKRINLNSSDANIMKVDVIPLAKVINETVINLHDALKYHSFDKTSEEKDICCLYLKNHLIPNVDNYFTNKNIICVETALQIILQDLLANAIKHSPEIPDINIGLKDTEIEDLPVEFLELYQKFKAEEYKSLSISNKNNTELGLENYKNMILQNNLSPSNIASIRGFGIDTIKRILKFDSLGSDIKPWFFAPKRNCYNETCTTIFLLIPKNDFYNE